MPDSFTFIYLTVVFRSVVQLVAEGGGVYTVHKAVLAADSEYFRKLFSGDNLEYKTDTQIELVRLEGVDSKLLQAYINASYICEMRRNEPKPKSTEWFASLLKLHDTETASDIKALMGMASLSERLSNSQMKLMAMEDLLSRLDMSWAMVGEFSLKGPEELHQSLTTHLGECYSEMSTAPWAMGRKIISLAEDILLHHCDSKTWAIIARLLPPDFVLRASIQWSKRADSRKSLSANSTKPNPSQQADPQKVSGCLVGSAPLQEMDISTSKGRLFQF